MFPPSATDLICAYNERYAFGLGKLTNLPFFTDFRPNCAFNLDI